MVASRAHQNSSSARSGPNCCQTPILCVIVFDAETLDQTQPSDESDEICNYCNIGNPVVFVCHNRRRPWEVWVLLKQLHLRVHTYRVHSWLWHCLVLSQPMATLHAAATETLHSLADRSLATATASLTCCDGLWKLAVGRHGAIRQHCLAVPHVQQSYNWDCGLACALMVLKSLDVACLDMGSLRSLCSTTSVWTVDLAHLMRHFGLEVTLATTMVGANPGYFHEGFYMENMAEDQCRVTQLFKEAERAGIIIHQRSIPIRELQACMLAGSHLIIALVDKRRLCSGFMSGALQVGGVNCLPGICGYGEEYTGHYVVICGYNADTDSFILQDPAAGCCNITVTSATFDAARKAYGTDEDLLIVPLADRQVSATDVHKVQVYGKTSLCDRCRRKITAAPTV